MRESIFLKLFKRSDKNCSLIKWLKLTLLEAYLGDQLLDLLASFASYTESNSVNEFLFGEGSRYKLDLSEFIPATFINRILELHIVELLKIKYINHYEVIIEFSKPVPVVGIPTEEPIHYEVNPRKLFMLTELRLSYNTIWVSFNIVIDILVFLYTSDLVAALVTGGFVEFVRRFKI